jgi:hypothetical protein
MERPTEALIARAPPETQALTRPVLTHEYHVMFDGRHWNVIGDGGETGPSSLDRDMAVTLAIRAAHQDHADGLDVAVSVEEQDGSFHLAWSSL